MNAEMGVERSGNGEGTARRNGSRRVTARQIWFQLHKWIGLLLLLLIVPISLTGSLLVWHDWTDGIANPQRYAVSESRATLPAEAYLASARTVLKPTDRIASIAFPAEAGTPVVVTASSQPPMDRPAAGPPPRYQAWLDPATGAVVDHADPRTGILRTLHVLHGSLMIPGVGRKIVGWVGWAMLASCLTGLWLWWPRIGSVFRGLRWRRAPQFSSNLHHQFGFWIALPLAVLSFTGAYISFPDFFRGVERSIGVGAPAPAQSGPAGPRPRPLAEPRLEPDAVLALAGGIPLELRWPTDRDSKWQVIAEERTLNVDDASGAVSPAKPPATTVARFMRQLHDAHDYNVVWQTIVFIGGIIPALLAVTGVLMWLRTRRWRGNRKRAA